MGFDPCPFFNLLLRMKWTAENDKVPRTYASTWRSPTATPQMMSAVQNNVVPN
jgi:hypothetical protein